MKAVRINTLRRYEHTGARAGGKVYSYRSCRAQSQGSQGQYYAFSAAARSAVCYAESRCSKNSVRSAHRYSMSKSRYLLMHNTFSPGTSYK